VSKGGFEVPLLTCAPASLFDEHDAPQDRAVRRTEHASALHAQQNAALALRASPLVLAAVAANPSGEPDSHLLRAMKAVTVEVQVPVTDPVTGTVKLVTKHRPMTAADIREHGPRAFRVLPELRELMDATAKREKAGQ
jgi:uncharacterized NAD-dependent epimerase/dehydratase family protein